MNPKKTQTILAIETSCDDTAISIVTGRLGADISVPVHLVSSQTAIHAHWGGVVPHLAKREHSRNLIPLLKQALKQANLAGQPVNDNLPVAAIDLILEKNPDLKADLMPFLTESNRPDITTIAVTAGPGLEPALWTGLNLAKILALAWQVPLTPVNHLLGHLVFPILSDQPPALPALGLIVSGGHTELIKISAWDDLTVIGQTRDDAAGEAFDKVARLLGLPYPGGPAIAKLANQYDQNQPTSRSLPRPMINSGDLDMSFSGLKTAVRYGLDKQPIKTEADRVALAYEFQQAVIEVLTAKTKQALIDYDLKTLIIGGGVAANRALRQALEKLVADSTPPITLFLPPADLSTDNATMIGLAALTAGARAYAPTMPELDQIKADGQRSLSTKNPMK